MAINFVPTDANTMNVAYGIENVLSGFIIQNENIQEQSSNLEVIDQKGRHAQIITYEKYYTLSLDAIGEADTPPARVGESFTWQDSAGTEIVYHCDTVSKSSTYNDFVKWNMTFSAYPYATYRDQSGYPD